MYLRMIQKIPFYPHIFLYLLEDKAKVLLAVNIEFKESLSLLTGKYNKNSKKFIVSYTNLKIALILNSYRGCLPLKAKPFLVKIH